MAEPTQTDNLVASNDEVLDDVLNDAEETAEELTDVANEASDFISNASDSIGNFSVDNLTSGATDLWNKTWDDMVPPPIPKSWPEVVGYVAGTAMGQMMSQVWDKATSIFTDTETQGWDKVTITIGGMGESIKTTSQKSYEKTVEAKTKPSASSCVSGQKAADDLGVRNKKEQLHQTVSSGMRSQALYANDDQEAYINQRIIKMAGYKASIGSSGSGGESSSAISDAIKAIGDSFSKNTVSIAALFDPTVVFNDAAYVNVTAAVESLVGFSVLNGTGSLRKYATDNKRYDATKMMKSARTLMSSLAAQTAFTGAIAKRLPTIDDETTFYTTMIGEIARTYADKNPTDESSWRSMLNTYTDQTANLQELNKLLAFNNYLLYQRVKMMEETTAIKAVRSLELVIQNAIAKSKKMGA
jgi:hypothetical protein